MSQVLRAGLVRLCATGWLWTCVVGLSSGVATGGCLLRAERVSVVTIDGDRDGPSNGDDASGGADLDADGNNGDAGGGDSSTPGGDTPPAVPACEGFAGGAFLGTGLTVDDALEYDGVTVWEIQEGGSPTTWFDSTDLVGLWHLNGAGAIASSDPVPDASSRGNHGVMTSAHPPTTSYQPGKLGTAMRLDGVDDHVRVTPVVSTDFRVDPGKRFTMAAWFRARAQAETQALLWQEGTCLGWSLVLTGAGHVSVRFGSGPSGCTDTLYSTMQSAGYDYRDDAWHQVVVVIDREATTMRLYLDGLLVAATSVDGVYSASGSSLIRLGTNWDNSEPLLGLLDEVAMWKRAVSPAEVRELYLHQSPRFAGEFIAPPCDAGAAVTWRTLAVRPRAPYGAPLALVDHTGYSAGNLAAAELTALWRMDGPVGTLVGAGVVSEATIHRHHAVPPMEDVSLVYGVGRLDQAIAFSGDANAHLVVGDADDLDLLGPSWSLTAWIRPGASGAQDRIIDHGGGQAGSGVGWSFGLENTAVERGLRLVIDGLNFRYSAPGVITVGEWQLVAVTFSGGTGAFYVNGAPAGVFAGLPSPAPADLPVLIGQDVAHLTAGNNALVGMIDEVAIWPQQLSETEMKGLYWRGAVRLLAQVRSCADAACALVSFVGPDGTAGSFFTERDNALPSPPSYPLLVVPPAAVFQYRIVMQLEDLSAAPEVEQVQIFAGP